MDETQDQNTTEATDSSAPGAAAQHQPDPAAEDMYKKQCSRIRKARKLRKDWERKYKVEQCEKFYLGDQNLEDGTRVLNHFLATVRVTQPNLLYENPKFMARALPGKQPITERLAAISEGIIDAVGKQDDCFANSTNLALLQNFFRIGVVKVVYDPELVPNPDAGQPVFQIDSVGEVMHDPTGQPMPEVDPQTGQPVTEPDMIVSGETYRFEWVDARNVLLPDEGPDMNKWTWIGEEVIVQLDDAKNDERFDPTLRALLTSNETRHNKNDQEAGKLDDKDDEEDQMLRYVECYDLKKKKWYVIAEGQQFQEPLLDEPLPDGIKDHPYAILPGWIPIVGPKPSSWPLPFTYPWLDPQSEYNTRRNQMMNAAKHSARKVLYTDGTFDDQDSAIRMMKSSTDMEGVKLRDMTQKPEIMVDPSSNPDVSNDTVMLLNDYRYISGQTAAKIGVAETQTATEASIMDRASNLRDAELQKAVNKWLKTCGKKMWLLVKNTLTLEMWVNIRGMNDKEVGAYFERVYGLPAQMMDAVPGMKELMMSQHGQEKPLRVTRENLTFETDLEVIAGSTRPRTLAAEKAEFLELLTLIAKAPQILLSRALLEEMAKKYDFISASTIDELQMLAQMMMQVNSAQAGREQGGGGSTPENTQGQGNTQGTQQNAANHRAPA